MCTMTFNSQLNGIELVFAEKPAEEIREQLKALGFRWHRQKKLWYAKKTAERMALAEKLSSGNIATETASAPAEIVSKYGIKVGDILTGSWGYNMTVAEAYKVTRIVSPCKVELLKIGFDLQSADTGGGENLLPNPEKEIGEPFIKNIVADRYSNDENAYYIKINNSCNIRPYSGGTVYQNAWD